MRRFFIGLAALVFVFWRWKDTDSGADRIDRAILSMPLLGDIRLKYQVASFSRMLSTLLQGGLPLVPSMETAGASMTSRRILKGVMRAGVRVREGQSLAASLEEQKIFPELAVEMIEVGESTGALPAMLNSVAEFYEEDVQTALGAAMALIEPVILIFMAVFVGGVLISLYLPIFTLGGCIRAVSWSLVIGRLREGLTTKSLMTRQVRQEWQRPIRKSLFVSGGNGGPMSPTAESDDRLERAQDVARRYRCEFIDLQRLPSASRSVQEDPGRPDVPLQLRAAGRDAGRTAGHRHCRSQPVDDDRRDQPAAEQAHRHQSCDAEADLRHSQEDRAVAARAGRSQRRLHARRHPRRRNAGRRNASPSTS